MGRKKKRSNKITNGISSIAGSLKAPNLDLASETKRSITVIIFLVLAGVSALTLLGSAGFLGEYLNRLLLMLFGIIAYLVPILLLLIAWMLFRARPKVDENSDEDEEVAHPYARTYIGMFLLTIGAAGVIHAISTGADNSAFAVASEGRAGGYLGALLVAPLVGSLGFWAGGLIILGISIIGVMIAFNISPIKLLSKLQEKKQFEIADKVTELKINAMREVIDADPGDEEEVELEDTEEQEDREQVINIGHNRVDEATDMDSIVLEDRRDWKLPPFDLLKDNKSKVDSGNIESNVELIKKTLSDFGIKVDMDEVNVGPTVTQYTFKPAPGVKLAQIHSLQNNLALALAAQDIRMELPIPGRALVGIEVPNKTTALVTLREVMQTSDFVKHPGRLVLAVGRDVAGRPHIVDLAKMPHMLIAGQTGSGKSIAINSLIISLLYKNTPQDLKFIMVDPKHVELTPYNGIPHLLTPAITETDKAINALKWAVAEMERRYSLVAQAGKRNIKEYNEKLELKLPYIVIVVDELANLMAAGKSDVELMINRLASLSRAVGIHLVLATQRPDTNVVTGLIKANIPTRVAFRLPSQIDSRTILDSGGAEKLLGNGDMLFVSTDQNKSKRVQGAFVDDKEVHKIVDFFKQQTGAVIYNEEITEQPKRSLNIPGMKDNGDDAGDELYEEAKAEVVQAGKASASLLQRRLRIGYARAARILDILEDDGVVGPADGSKPREVYEVSSQEKEGYGIEPE